MAESIFRLYYMEEAAAVSWIDHYQTHYFTCSRNGRLGWGTFPDILVPEPGG